MSLLFVLCAMGCVSLLIYAAWQLYRQLGSAETTYRDRPPRGFELLPSASGRGKLARVDEYRDEVQEPQRCRFDEQKEVWQAWFGAAFQPARDREATALGGASDVDHGGAATQIVQ